MYLTTITPVYTITSLLCSLGSFIYAFFLLRTFDVASIISYILSSKVNICIHVNSIYIIMFLVGRVGMAFFIGKIRKKEWKQFQEKMVEYTLKNLILVFCIINKETYTTVLWISWFTIVGFFKVFSIIARERSRYYMTAHEIQDAHVKHAKLMSLLVTILLCDLALIAISVKVIGFAMFGMLLIMLYECWIILIEITQIILKYQMFLHEYYHRKFWEGREEIGYLLDFALEISRQTSAIAHNFHLWMVDGYSLSIIDLALLLFINSSFTELRKHVNRFMQYLSVTSAINSTYSYPTADELKENETCIICHDNMTPTSSKKLDCGHIFHVGCIKKWMQKSFTCPVCRKPLLNKGYEEHEEQEPTYLVTSPNQYSQSGTAQQTETNSEEEATGSGTNSRLRQRRSGTRVAVE